MKISNETKIGVLTTITITVLILMYSYLSGADVFSRSNKFYAVYKSVDGLSVSKPVLVNGFQIGHVSKMVLRPDGRTVVEFKIDHQYNVTRSTHAQLISTDLLGGKAIKFEYGESKEPAQDGDTLSADIQGSLAESLQPIQMKAEHLISKLDLRSGHSVLDTHLDWGLAVRQLEGGPDGPPGVVAAPPGLVDELWSLIVDH